MGALGFRDGACLRSPKKINDRGSRSNRSVRVSIQRDGGRGPAWGASIREGLYSAPFNAPRRGQFSPPRGPGS